MKVSLDNLELATITDSFHQQHEHSYSFRLDAPIEIVNIHLVVFGEVEKSPMRTLPAADSTSAEVALIGHRDVEYRRGELLSTALYNRDRLLPGMHIEGPAIIEEKTTTTVVNPRNRVEVDPYGGLHIHLDTPSSSNHTEH